MAFIDAIDYLSITHLFLIGYKYIIISLLINGIDYSLMPLITHQLPIYFSLVTNISLYPLPPPHVRNT